MLKDTARQFIVRYKYLGPTNTVVDEMGLFVIYGSSKFSGVAYELGAGVPHALSQPALIKRLQKYQNNASIYI